ncbi:T9SS type A sorting domain-containing protein [Psychroserpens sp. AS72]|uniref:T9SS type A sorting domain-containing protein n=1 Tax=Psychroserpens sp. AS72 TaxID=3135775 RepID=UPI0031791989
MKKTLHFLLIGIAIINSGFLFSQNTEDFESETTGSTTFTDNGLAFTITTIESGPAIYDIEFFASGGYNGSGNDDKFIDNSTGSVTQGDGTSFSILTSDGTDITLKSFYLFVSNRSISGPGTPTTLTFEGRKDGGNVFTITKSTGIIDGSTFTPNNGFTFIDFATEGGTDNSNENIDEIIISSTDSADYLALDAFSWDVEVLSTNEFEIDSNQIKIIPNPSSDYFQLSGLKESIEFNIFDLLGKKVSSGKISPNQKTDISKLNNGIYFIRLDNVKTIKFIKI